jgi:hypothetical protein
MNVNKNMDYNNMVNEWQHKHEQYNNMVNECQHKHEQYNNMGISSAKFCVFPVFLFSEWGCEEIVTFVDIGGIVDYHCWNFLL